MRIGIVTTWFERGAAYVSKQYQEILAEEHQVFIYARGGESYAKGDPRWDSPEVTWGKRNWEASTAVNLSDFQKWLLHKKIDLVLFNEQKWWPAIQLCNRLGILNGAYIDYYKENTIPVYGLHDFIICNTKRHMSAFEWHPGARYLPWGTDTQLFGFCGTGRIDSQRVIFFHSAGMAPERKGTDLLIKAFSEMEEQASKLIIHTQLDLTEKYPAMQNLLDQMQNEDRLEIIKETVGAPGLYHRGDVYVYPTRLEGIGLTIAEALSCGLPSIVPDWPPMNEFVSEESGTLVPIDKLYCRSDGYYWPLCEVSIKALALAMDSYVLRRNDISSMKQNARNFAEKHLDWKKNASGLLDIIRNITPLPEEFKKPYSQMADQDNKKNETFKNRVKRGVFFRFYKAISP